MNIITQNWRGTMTGATVRECAATFFAKPQDERAIARPRRSVLTQSKIALIEQSLNLTSHEGNSLSKRVIRSNRRSGCQRHDRPLVPGDLPVPQGKDDREQAEADPHSSQHG